MNTRLDMVLNVMLTGFLAQFSMQDCKMNASKGIWSNELHQRLNKHSCKPGDIQKDTTLLHKLKSGTFIELGHVNDVEVCVLQCCESKHCELALFKDNFCYGITCYSPQHCKTVPAYEGDNSMAAVFVTKAKTNLTKYVTYPCCDVGTTNSQSEDRKTKQKTAEFVFYPSDSSTDLAFSVNLRKIAKHYVHDERVRNALTAKADEDITRRKINTFNAKGGQHTSQTERTGIDMTGYERNLGRENIGNRNESTLDEFLSRNHGRPSKDSHTAQSGKRSETFRKLPTKHKSTMGIEWRVRLLKAFIASSSVALLIVLLALLAMTRRKRG